MMVKGFTDQDDIGPLETTHGVGSAEQPHESLSSSSDGGPQSTMGHTASIFPTVPKLRPGKTPPPTAAAAAAGYPHKVWGRGEGGGGRLVRGRVS